MCMKCIKHVMQCASRKAKTGKTDILDVLILAKMRVIIVRATVRLKLYGDLMNLTLSKKESKQIIKRYVHGWTDPETQIRKSYLDQP